MFTQIDLKVITYLHLKTAFVHCKIVKKTLFLSQETENIPKQGEQINVSTEI